MIVAISTTKAIVPTHLSEAISNLAYVDSTILSLYSASTAESARSYLNAIKFKENDTCT
jgi:hypothetical protein